jgi:hypothetical protein
LTKTFDEKDGRAPRVSGMGVVYEGFEVFERTPRETIVKRAGVRRENRGSEGMERD